VVAWGCDDGCGLYSSWDARGGIIVIIGFRLEI
jgi:hypothetical protein